MRHSNQGGLRHQVRFLRRQFLQGGDLPFSNVLSEEVIARALTVIGVYWMDRVYSPLVTLWVFLGQVLSADHSCRAPPHIRPLEDLVAIVYQQSQRGQPCKPRI